MILIANPSHDTDTAIDILFRSTTDRLASHCRSRAVPGSDLNWKRLRPSRQISLHYVLFCFVPRLIFQACVLYGFHPTFSSCGQATFDDGDDVTFHLRRHASCVRNHIQQTHTIVPKRKLKSCGPIAAIQMHMWRTMLVSGEYSDPPPLILTDFHKFYFPLLARRLLTTIGAAGIRCGKFYTRLLSLR